MFITLGILVGTLFVSSTQTAVAASYSIPDSYDYNYDSSDWENDWSMDSSDESSQSSTTYRNTDPAIAGGMLLGLGVLWIIFVGLMVIVGILGMVFWIFMLVDVAKRESLSSNDRLLWILVIVLASYLGAIIYYFMIRRPAKKAERAAMTPVTPPVATPAKESTSSTPTQK